jgi:hypothetical protein
MHQSVGFGEAISRPRGVPKTSKKELRSIEIEKGEKGGHTVTHRFKQEGNGVYHESEGPHIFGESEGKKLLAHLTEHLGINAGKEE